MAPAAAFVPLGLTALLVIAPVSAAPASAELPPAKAQSTLVSPAEAEYSRRWDQSVHGNMLRRILPPGPDPATLPEPGSAGADLLTRYCVQCHHLPSPAMHTPANWPRIVERMVWRMEGKGNMGTLMKDMMDHVQAPAAQDRAVLLAYLKKHGQKPIDPGRYPDLATPQGQAFELACSQCHELPDPKRHTVREWPKVVERMRKHLAWHGTIEGGPKNAVELRVSEILAFLTRHGRAR